MAITKILTTADDSAGSDKVDARPVASRAVQFTAAEWNNVKNAVIAILGHLGMGDGSTVGSLIRDWLGNRGISNPAIGYREDFIAVSKAAAGDIEYTDAVTGTGTCTIGTGTGTGDGIGHVVNTVGAGAGTSSFRGTHATISPKVAPEYRFRFKTPATFANLTGYVGLRDSAGTSRATLGWNATGDLISHVASTTGGGTTGDVDTGVNLVADTWYEGRVVVADNVQTDLYLNDVLVQSVAGATTRLRTGDLVAHYQRVDFVAATGGSLRVDWYELRGTRA